MQATPLAGIILAAGKGTRMKSDLAKGLHPVCGLPMVELVVRAMREAGVERPIVVIGHGGEAMKQALGEDCDYAWQREQLGTGHAALMAAEFLAGYDGPVLVAPGDAPLLTGAALKRLAGYHRKMQAECTLASVELDDPTGYGRIVRDKLGLLTRIVEQKDAYEGVREIKEINVSVYCFDARTLFRLLPTLGKNNSQGEYYLTDVLAAIVKEGSHALVEKFEEPETFLGVNDRWQLAEADKALRRRILRKHALSGVTIRDPDTVMIGPDVSIGHDAIIEAGTTLGGKTEVGPGCRVGPYTIVDDSVLGRNCLVYMSRLSEARLGDEVKVGPFANLRPGCVLENRVKVGNFVEVKNSTIGEGAAASHLAYLGDTSVGPGTNVGAGTITCNYDGFAKHRTEIGANAFIGSNSTLVAPITIGDGALIAAGSVITRDVPADALGLGRAKQEVKENWAAQWRKRRKP
ncbi:MAG: bifunctional UDP-N-acetylglucosamine diphosphorylase/glucosamine-1-phosphate N-acetyltransferase GlmU [Fimbriimonas ginsengisoli]|uniref:Bifunctional protein GlmU n=1 Tax=Fimbriimonas ginsengisoli TaxID=1005039 RepID=A0A931PTJ2_FIMGI|nr:bifunctional UDP-N-acetylglucosamine diphosphorylase/glucosamine-1-phosphate N-acetyltransferase GlmU [Fimbriimonas ginsengisoli]